MALWALAIILTRLFWYLELELCAPNITIIAYHRHEKVVIRFG